MAAIWGGKLSLLHWLCYVNSVHFKDDEYMSVVATTKLDASELAKLTIEAWHGNSPLWASHHLRHPYPLS